MEIKCTLLTQWRNMEVPFYLNKITNQRSKALLLAPAQVDIDVLHALYARITHLQ